MAAFSAVLRVRNILASFDAFEDDDPASARELQDYQSEYLAVRDEMHDRERSEKESIADDLVFEMELVRQVEINIDYILMLVEQRHGDHVKDREIAARIMSSVAASPELRDKSELIERFLEIAGFGEADGCDALCAGAKRVVTLVTCSANFAGGRARTLTVFVG